MPCVCNLLWLGRNKFLVLSLGTSLDILEILANIPRQMEGNRILSLKISKKRAEKSSALFWLSGKILRLANIAEPLIGETLIVNRRIDALEVECARAAIATDQVAIPTA